MQRHWFDAVHLTPMYVTMVKFVNNPSLDLDIKRADAYTLEPIYANEITPEPND